MTNKPYYWWIFHAKYWVEPQEPWQQNDAIIDKPTFTTQLDVKDSLFKSSFSKEGPFSRKESPSKIGFNVPIDK